MDMYSSIRLFPAMVSLISLISVSAMAQVDVNSLRAASSRSAAEYDSGRSVGSRKGFIGPEESGRPGVYFFKKAVKAFENDQIAFAMDMYEAAASWGYKPAEYNLSVMYARGQGIPVNMPRAMAWIALAAERGDSHYVSARDAINIKLSSDQVAEANRILEELKPKFADATALRRANRRWRDVKLEATGSRLGFIGGLKVGAAGSMLANTSPGLDSTAPFEVTSGKHNDASIEYRQLQESDSPYAPKDRVRTGSATVGPLEAIPDLARDKSGSAESKEDASKQ
jgi:TPR repeat protein